MDHKIQVLDTTIHCYTAKECMAQMVEYMQNDLLNVVELITMQNLASLLENEEYRNCLEDFDLTFAGNKEVLETAGVKDKKLLEESEQLLVAKMFMRYLHKTKARVYLMTSNQDVAKSVEEHLLEKCPGIVIVGHSVVEEDSVSNEAIVNDINGTEADCILSFMKSPEQEAFLVSNRSLLNAKMWWGIGEDAHRIFAEDSIWARFVRNMRRKFLAKRIKKEQKKNAN